MLSARAAAGGARYVDVYTPSIGHDSCSSTRWVEPLIPLSTAAPIHPNALGMRGMSTAVTAAVTAG
jgi:hypothetical protein